MGSSNRDNTATVVVAGIVITVAAINFVVLLTTELMFAGVNLFLARLKLKGGRRGGPKHIYAQ